MSDKSGFLGTRIDELVNGLAGIYERIDRDQAVWKNASPFHCRDGCGSCCEDFEPDVLECEAVYLAAWMMHHQPERANSILDGSFVPPRPDPERGCVFYDPANPYHCTVYGGRVLICRLFAYTGDRGKDGLSRWKPCKFLPLEGTDRGEERRRQYSGAELEERFGAAPPIMSDITAQAVALSPDSANDRKPLRAALLAALERLTLLKRFIGTVPSPENPEPNSPQPNAPQPRAS